MYVLFLNDNETFSSLDGCAVVWVDDPDALDACDGKLRLAVADGHATVVARFDVPEAPDASDANVSETVAALRNLAARLESSALADTPVDRASLRWVEDIPGIGHLNAGRLETDAEHRND